MTEPAPVFEIGADGRQRLIGAVSPHDCACLPGSADHEALQLALLRMIAGGPPGTVGALDGHQTCHIAKALQARGDLVGVADHATLREVRLTAAGRARLEAAS